MAKRKTHFDDGGYAGGDSYGGYGYGDDAYGGYTPIAESRTKDDNYTPVSEARSKEDRDTAASGLSAGMSQTPYGNATFDPTPYAGPGVTDARAVARHEGVGGLAADGYQRSAIGRMADAPVSIGGIGSLLSLGARGLDRFTNMGWTHPDQESGGQYAGSSSRSGGVSDGVDSSSSRFASASQSGGSPFGGSTPSQTTPAAPGPTVGTGTRRYVWDPVKRSFELVNVGEGGNPMGYTQGQEFRMAAGGHVPSGLAAANALPARFVKGGGTGLSDSVPVKLDDGEPGRLANGEFVIPADVVSALGEGSSEAGARILYSMMERVRRTAHGSKEQIRPVDPGQVLPA